jgi:hypothetical protein
MPLMPQDPLDGKRNEQTLFTGPLQVPAGQRRALTFTTQSNFKGARIAGNVHAQGGSGNDIRVLVLSGQSVVYDSAAPLNRDECGFQRARPIHSYIR